LENSTHLGTWRRSARKSSGLVEEVNPKLSIRQKSSSFPLETMGMKLFVPFMIDVCMSSTSNGSHISSQTMIRVIDQRETERPARHNNLGERVIGVRLLYNHKVKVARCQDEYNPSYVDCRDVFLVSSQSKLLGREAMYVGSIAIFSDDLSSCSWPSSPQHAHCSVLLHKDMIWRDMI